MATKFSKDTALLLKDAQEHKGGLKGIRERRKIALQMLKEGTLSKKDRENLEWVLRENLFAALLRGLDRRGFLYIPRGENPKVLSLKGDGVKTWIPLNVEGDFESETISFLHTREPINNPYHYHKVPEFVSVFLGSEIVYVPLVSKTLKSTGNVVEKEIRATTGTSYLADAGVVHRALTEPGEYGALVTKISNFDEKYNIDLNEYFKMGYFERLRRGIKRVNMVDEAVKLYKMRIIPEGADEKTLTQIISEFPGYKEGVDLRSPELGILSNLTIVMPLGPVKAKVGLEELMLNHYDLLVVYDKLPLKIERLEEGPLYVYYKKPSYPVDTRVALPFVAAASNI